MAEFLEEHAAATVYCDGEDTFAVWSSRPPRARWLAYPTAREFTLSLNSSCLRPHSYPCARFAHFPFGRPPRPSDRAADQSHVRRRPRGNELASPRARMDACPTLARDAPYDVRCTRMRALVLAARGRSTARAWQRARDPSACTRVQSLARMCAWTVGDMCGRLVGRLRRTCDR